MSQAHITLVVTILGMAIYGAFVIKKHKPIKAEELLTFAMWCGAIVAGLYMAVSAFGIARQAGQETNGLYLGIFGVYLILLAIQKIREMMTRLFAKPATALSARCSDDKALTEKSAP